MTRKANVPITGNRYTGAKMTAREAQTLDGCLYKFTKILNQMEDRGVDDRTLNNLAVAIQATVDTMIHAGRMNEISPASLR